MATKTSLSPADVCAILESCGKVGATLLKFGGLEVHFDGLGPKTVQIDKLVPEIAPNPVPATEIADIQDQIASESLVRDEIALKEERLALMAIENPAEFEQLIAEGELEEDDRVGNAEEDV